MKQLSYHSRFILVLLFTLLNTLPICSQAATPRYRIAACDWMMLKRQKLGEFKLAHELGADVTNEEIIDAANKMLVEIPDEKKERLLQLKKAGYRLFLLSNTIDIHWDYCVEHLFPYRNHGVEDYFEHCFLSQRMHLAKPDARIYEEVVKQANIYPDETLFIDDLKENCEAAEKLGIHTFQNVKFDDWLSLRF